MKCLNTIVLYDNCPEVEAYILEVSGIAEGKADIVVIVNSDPRSQAEEMNRRLREEGVENFRIINYGENIGYLNALLKTIQDTDTAAYDYFILSNTDIHYDQADFFRRLEKKKYPEKTGCIAPSVYNPETDSYSNPHYLQRIPKEKIERLIRIFRHPLLAKGYLKAAGIKAGKTKKAKQESCFVYSPHGCYMIFTRAFIEKIRGYEYGVKLYSEESAVGELLLKHGMKCYYDDSISVVHEASTVTGKVNYRKRFKAWRESLEYILKEFY